MDGSRDDVSSRTVALVLAAGALVRLALAAGAPLLSAEAYYWLWSQELAPGYHDHPPAVAALIALGDALLGPTPLGIRIVHVAATTLAFWLFHRLCRRMTDGRTALLSLVALQISPIGLPLGTLALPDGPLLLTWTAALLFFHRALADDRWTDWLLAGACTGLALLSKFNALQLPLIFAVTLCLTPHGPRGLLRAKPWIALALALVLSVVTIFWSLARHDGGALGTPFADGLEPEQMLVNLALYALLPFLALSPLLGWRAIRSTRDALRSTEARRGPETRFLLCALLVPCAFFAVVALVTRIHAHWVATALLPAIPLALRPRAGEGRRTPLVVCGGLTGLLVAAVWVAPRLGGPPENPGGWPGEETVGAARLRWKLAGDTELRERVLREIEARRGEETLFLASTNFHQLARTEWLIGRAAPAMVMRKDDAHQYAIWENGWDLVGGNALWIEGRRRKRTLERIQDRFATVTELEPITVTLDGSTHNRFEIYWCEDFRGVPGLTPYVPDIDEDDDEDRDADD